MAHVTFIHGISNMPPEPDLHRLWREALGDGDDPLPLGDLGIASSFVYWADVLYADPETDLAAYEGVVENRAAAVDGARDSTLPIAATPEEQAFLDRLRSRLTGLDEAEIAAGHEPSSVQGALERVPLPWFVKRPFLAAFLRDVHHYLFDVEHVPRHGTTFWVQQEIRRRFLAKLTDPAVTRPHIVVAHSMGTVIAYDCLKRVGDCVAVDGIMTLGSPLGLDEVQDKLQPGWTREDGFPADRLAGGWLNLFDRLDPVCGFDPALANDYRRAGAMTVTDQAVRNPGAWRHSLGKYLRQPAVRVGLRQLLQL